MAQRRLDTLLGGFRAQISRALPGSRLNQASNENDGLIWSD
jgi:hypothetical protein